MRRTQMVANADTKHETGLPHSMAQCKSMLVAALVCQRHAAVPRCARALIQHHNARMYTNVPQVPRSTQPSGPVPCLQIIGHHVPRGLLLLLHRISPLATASAP